MIQSPSFIVAASASVSLLIDSETDIESLKSVTCPILLNHGTNDRMVPFSDMDQISSYVGGPVECIPYTSEGHFYFHSMHKLGESVESFVRSCWGI